MKILKKSLMVTALSVGLAFTAGSSFASAVTQLHNGHGTRCDGEGDWHFVNNQTDGASSPGTIYVTFSCGTASDLADKVNKNVQHFNIETSGDCVLEGAYTNLPGRLVLSDYSCDKKEEPPK